MKKILVFVLACAVAVVGLLFSELKQESLQNADFVDSVTKLIPDDEKDFGFVESVSDEDAVVFGEYYYTVDDVAYYLAQYDELPPNYMTKKEAESLGWISSEGNLWEVAPGACIGGDRFGNYEKILPADGSYTECDVNYDGGYRGGERLVYDEDGNIWYTADHYTTFDQLYPQ